MRAKIAGINWPLPIGLEDDKALERLLFPDDGQHLKSRPDADWATIHLELRRKGVTLQLLWEENRCSMWLRALPRAEGIRRVLYQKAD